MPKRQIGPSTKIFCQNLMEKLIGQSHIHLYELYMICLFVFNLFMCLSHDFLHQFFVKILTKGLV